MCQAQISVCIFCQLIFRLASLFGVSEEAFIRATDDVILTLIDNIHLFIRWPEQQDYPVIAANFDEMGR